MKPLNEFLNEGKSNFKFTKEQVNDVADLIAKAIAKEDNAKTAVHGMKFDDKGAEFSISMDGEDYDGGSYVVKDNGNVINYASGVKDSVYANIGDTDIKQVIKNIKKYK
tara:strand:+ start:17216 stop:17542 length:327 start_codon:yes stop_codon:yes gene_type:complete